MRVSGPRTLRLFIIFVRASCCSTTFHTAKSGTGWGYAVFGKVAKGHGVVNKIKGVKTGRKGMHDDVPVEPIEIIKAEIVED